MPNYDQTSGQSVKQGETKADVIYNKLSAVDETISRLTGQISVLCGSWPEEIPSGNDPHRQLAPSPSSGALNDFHTRLDDALNRLQTLTQVLGRVVNA